MLRSLFKLFERALRTTAGAWLAYTLLGAALLHPLVARLSSHILADDVFIEPGRSDAYNFLWTYWWIQKSVLAGHNVYQCDWVLPPTGANLYFHTHVVLPTLLTLPLGVLLGPVGGYNSMILLMLSGGWTSDRTGHLTPEIVQRYERGARSLADLQLVPFPDIADAIPELRDSNAVTLRRR